MPAYHQNFTNLRQPQYSFGLIFLTLLGYLGNYFHLSLFFGIDFLFGSIATLIILNFYGLFWGVVASLIAGSYAYILWSHPYSTVILVAESFFVGFFFQPPPG